MNIDLSTINFKGGGGGSFAPPKLQMKMRGIARNGNVEITPSEGYEGLSEVEVNAALTGETSAIDFSIIGYDFTLAYDLNTKFNNDIAYSRSLYNAWDSNKTSALYLYRNDTLLVYAPNINTSNVTTMQSMFDGCSSLTTIPLIDTSNVTAMQSMFEGCSSLTSISLLNTSKVKYMFSMFRGCSSLKTIPLIDTSNVTSMSGMFNGCSNLKSIPQFDTSNVTNMNSMFQGCSKLTSIPQFDTSNVTNMNSMFYSCSNLTTIPNINTSNVTNMNGMFSYCSKLESIPLLDCGNVTIINGFFGYSNINTLTQLGGFKDLKIDWKDSTGLQRLPNLTYQSILNVLNNLYDFRGNGDTTTTRTIQFHANALAQMSDADKAIATNKGWVIS